uniref:Uncharacterized protein n=1 Tax=Tanacetum cinerariifolium TaxID=118510 RepID=A0A6L2LAV4_TANCI|nr:hypothetical protein [Tanacetum cinerariifolium]
MRLAYSIPLFFIFATLAVCIVSQFTNCSTKDTLISLQGRRSLKTLEDLKPDINKVDGNARSIKKVDLTAKAYDANNNEDGEMVYHIDYQGVKTHPSPTPKHHP